MVDTNYISGIVKILENPLPTVLNNNILITKFRVQFPQVRNNIIVNLVFWNNLGRDVVNRYRVNDYILIEGYLSRSDKQTTNLRIENSKRVEIIVLKVYPFLSSYNCEVNKK
jgi:hypothetical protein